MSDRTDGPSAAVRIRVFKRDRFSCSYCGASGTDSELEVDHIIPVAKGGSHHISNLTTSCRQCNQGKGKAMISPPRHGKKDRQFFPSSPPIGLFFHVFDEKGDLRNQCLVIGVDGDRILAQYFSWTDGSPTSVGVFAREFLYSETCKLYASEEVWNDAAQQWMENDRRKREGTVQ